MARRYRFASGVQFWMSANGAARRGHLPLRPSRAGPRSRSTRRAGWDKRPHVDLRTPRLVRQVGHDPLLSARDAREFLAEVRGTRSVRAEHDPGPVGRERRRLGAVGGGCDNVHARLGRPRRRRLAQTPHRRHCHRGHPHPNTATAAIAIHASRSRDDAVAEAGVCAAAVSSAPSTERSLCTFMFAGFRSRWMMF